MARKYFTDAPTDRAIQACRAVGVEFHALHPDDGKAWGIALDGYGSFACFVLVHYRANRATGCVRIQAFYGDAGSTGGDILRDGIENRRPADFHGFLRDGFAPRATTEDVLTLASSVDDLELPELMLA